VFTVAGTNIFITKIVDTQVDVYVVTIFTVELYVQRNIFVIIMAHGCSLYRYKLRVAR